MKNGSVSLFCNKFCPELPQKYQDNALHLCASEQLDAQMKEAIKTWRIAIPPVSSDGLPVAANMTEYDLLPLGITSSTYKEPARTPEFYHDNSVSYVTLDTSFRYALLDGNTVVGGLSGEIMVSGDDFYNKSGNTPYSLNIVLAINAVQLDPAHQNRGYGKDIIGGIKFLLHQHLKQIYLNPDIYYLKHRMHVNLTLTATPKSTSGEKWLASLASAIEEKQAQLTKDIGIKLFQFHVYSGSQNDLTLSSF